MGFLTSFGGSFLGFAFSSLASPSDLASFSESAVFCRVELLLFGQETALLELGSALQLFEPGLTPTPKDCSSFCLLRDEALCGFLSDRSAL